MPILEGDESGAADAGDWSAASRASLGEQLAETLGAVRLVVARREALAGQRRVAVGAREAFAMPRLVLVCHTAARDDLIAFDAARGKLLLVAIGAVDLVFTWDERLGADRGLADDAAEALLVPLPTLVFHLLSACSKDFAASVASSGERRIVTVGAVHLLALGAERLVDERHSALVA